MRTLWLLRHAKSERGDDSTGDHERPLNARGQDDARRMGRFLADRGIAPDLVLCSSALRTRQTLGALAGELAEPPPQEVHRELYLASTGELLTRLQAAPESARQLLVIAHNPGIAELAVLLSPQGDPALREAMTLNYPTCALAELEFDAPSWSGLSQGCALRSFTIPSTAPESPPRS